MSNATLTPNEERMLILRQRIKEITTIGTQSNVFLRIEKNKTVSFHVLSGEYGDDALWYLQIGYHFLGKKRITCSGLNDGSCYICDQIAAQEEELANLKNLQEELVKSDPSEANRMVEALDAGEKGLNRMRTQKKFAINVLVRGEDIPRIYEAPWGVFKPIFDMFNSSVMDHNIDIMDPLSSTAFAVTKTGESFMTTKYSVAPAPRGVPIAEGADRDAKIAKILKAVPDLNEKYKLPELSDQMAAYNSFVAATGAPTTPPPAPVKATPSALSKPQASRGPVPLSHASAKATAPVPPSAVAAAKVEPDEEESTEYDPVQDIPEEEEEAELVGAHAVNPQKSPAATQLLKKLKASV